MHFQMKKLVVLFKWLFSNKIRTVLIILVLIAASYFGYKNLVSKNPAPTYQTAQVTKGTLVTSVTASGTITSANNINITTQASGLVNNVLVKNGDEVYQGQVIATLTLDAVSLQKQASNWASYLSAKNSVDTANAKINSLQAALFKANQTFINDAVERELATNDPTYIQQNALWLQSEADYKNQQGSLAAARASFSASALALYQTSNTITAPISGTVKGLTITSGTTISGDTQVLGSIYQSGPTQASVNISEVDSVNVSIGQKVTMTLDAFSNQTFTGKIVSINTNGIVSSGVTTYPAVIALDVGNDHIYPNMGANAAIITSVKNNVIIVPSSAITTNNGQSTVRVMKNGVVESVPVEVGISNTTETEIVSGINENDVVVTSIVTASTGSSAATSPFGSRNAFGGGGAMRVTGGR